MIKLYWQLAKSVFRVVGNILCGVMLLEALRVACKNGWAEGVFYLGLILVYKAFEDRD